MGAKLDAETIQGKYLAHFMGFPDARTVEDAATPFEVLHYRVADGVHYGYATLGLSSGPVGHEIAVVTQARRSSVAMAAVTAGVARAAPPDLTPLTVVPYAIDGTPFEAMFFLPVPNGTIVLGQVDGEPCYLLNAVPITRAERELSERDPVRLLEMLRAAHALEADLHRACVVTTPTPPQALTEAAAERRKARAVLVKAGQELREREAARARRAGEEDEEREPDGPAHDVHADTVRLAPYDRDGLVLTAQAIVELAVHPFVHALPPRVAFLVGEVIYVTLATHPDAVRLLDAVVDPDEPRAEITAEKVASDLVAAIGRCHPAEDPTRLSSAARAAIEGAAGTFDAKDEIPMENHAWARALPAVYASVRILGTRQDDHVREGIAVMAEREELLEYEWDPRPPLARLREIAARIAVELVFAVYVAQGPSPRR